MTILIIAFLALAISFAYQLRQDEPANEWLFGVMFIVIAALAPVMAEVERKEKENNKLKR